MAECLLGGTALRGAGGCEADSRRALVLVAGSPSVMGGLGPQRPLYIGWLRLALFGRSRRQLLFWSEGVSSITPPEESSGGPR